MKKSSLHLAPLPLFVLCVNLITASPVRAQADAAKIFKTNCTLCHGADGSGDTSTGKAMKAKDLRSDEVQKQSDAELADIISKGRGKMPAFGSKISADSIKSLVAYIRQLPKK
ncbi:MAG TPA: cytochrome c [Candidatus Acidoferrales bacterium]